MTGPGTVVERILVPLDGSETSAEILPLARSLAVAYGAELILHGVVELPKVEPLVYPPLLSTEVMRAKLEAYRAGLADVRCRTKAEIGWPVDAILDIAAAEKVDLIAMTTHGRTGLSRLAFGSVAEAVLRRAPCPVVLKRIGATVAGAAP